MNLPRADLRRFRTLTKAYEKRPTQRLARLIEITQRRLSDADSGIPRRVSDARAARRKSRRKMQCASRRRNR